MTLDDPSAYLASKGVEVFRANGAEVTIHCPFCPDGDPKGKGKLYINTETWLFHCKRCDTKGNRRTLLTHYGDEDTVEYLPGQDPARARAVLEAATSIAHEMLLNNDEMLEYLVGRGLSAQTISGAQYGYVPRSWSLSNSLGEKFHRQELIAAGVMTDAGRDFFQGKITIPYHQHGSVVQLRAKDPKGKYFTPAGHPVRLYGTDDLGGAQDVFVTEGEFDRDIVRQVLSLSTDAGIRKIAVVGIPGANSLPAGFETYFSEARRVYLGLDPDETGKKAAIKVKEMLGSKARIIQLPEVLPKCDWTEFLRAKTEDHPHGGHGLADIQELMATAAGKRLWSVSDAQAKWKRRQVEAPGIKFGFAELDAWFKPGLEPGDVVVPLAKTGTGKTNFLTSIARNTLHVPTLFVSLEMTAAQIYERLQRGYRFFYPYATESEIAEAMRLLRIVDENRLNEGDIAHLCDEYTEEVGVRPRQVMLDYLGYFAKGCKGSGAYEKTTNAAMALKAEAKAAEVGIIAPHQVNRTAQDGRPLEADSARDSGAVEETADLLVSLYRPDEAIAPTADAMPSSVVRLGVLKNRKGGKGMVTSLVFSAASLVLVDAGTQAARKAEEESRLVWRGESYESIFRAQTTRQLRLVN